MADLKSETTQLLGNESKEVFEDMESPNEDKDCHSFDANSVDSNKTLTGNQNNNENNDLMDQSISDNKCNESRKRDINVETRNDCKSDQNERRLPSEPLSRPFFTFPRFLSGRRKRIKRKSMVSNDRPVAAIEEHPENDSVGQMTANTTNNYNEYRNKRNVYVKESFFIRLMRHLASPVHGGHRDSGQGYRSPRTQSAYLSEQRSSTLDRRRSKPESFTSSASNGDINRHHILIEQNSHNRNHSAVNGFEVPAVCGIKNHGNTCFMTAIIQCLCNTDLLAEYFVMNHYRSDSLRHNKLHAKKYGTKGELTEQLALLLKSLWSCMYSSEISSKFKTLMAKYSAQYEGSEQHDAQEFLLWLLDKCHEDLNIANKKKYKKIKSLSNNRSDEIIAAETLANYMRCNSSFIHDLFQAQLRSSLVCRSCGKHSNTFDPYLCLSLPVPIRLTHTLLINSVFLDRKPREIKIGVTIESLATIRELRDKISRLLKIPEKQLILLLIGQEFGLKELAKDSDIVQEVLEDMNEIYALETPKVDQNYTNHNSISSNGSGQKLTLIWSNRVGIGNQGKIFGPLFSCLISREASYKQIQLDIISAMRSMLKHDSDISSISCSLNLRLRVIGGIPGKAYLPEDVDHPLYMPTVDKALTGCEDKEYRGPIHLKIMVEWDLDMRQTLIIADDQMNDPVVDSSIELAKARSQKTNRASLRDCFDMYFKEERLCADNAWTCPSCKRRQQCTKKLNLWSVPDIFIIHLKRFRQSSQSQRNKVTTHVVFPQTGLDMSAYIVPRAQTNGNITNGLPALWSPSKRSRMYSRFITRTDDNIYDLYAVCNHKGNMQSGHYTAFCRNPIDNCWYHFDDTKVVPVNESSVITSDAYILFYQRSSLSSAFSSCSSSSTSGYSSSASSYYSDHWAFRMPPFNYWSPKSSKSHDNLFSEINERNGAKSGVTTPPTPGAITRDITRYASLPSKSSQFKTKSLQTETKITHNNYNNNNNDTNDLKVIKTELKTNSTSVVTTINTTNSSVNNNNINSNNNKATTNLIQNNCNESTKITDNVDESDNNVNVWHPKADSNTYWAITSV
ncbi:ubiquitin carboxyl-terminal hydrolase 31-like [Oppia nitens]|uniref:ubiquitin carboxyl-terminal hydrolase 31-like n=1 Tax=Oppia nitens TaxID=1686743 RepID=UPI0023DBA222|nr:ubiquitin carboxyl-terminal hydrolase 31-like [Oppia nitens]